MNFKSRGINCLLGLHIGDSLGASIEFEAPHSPFNFHREIIGKGPFDWEPGAPTDDTQLMLLLLNNLAKNRGFSQSQYANQLIQWMDAKPVDIGTTTQASIRRLKQGLPYGLAGVRGEHNQSNGSLMRCAPLVLLYNEVEIPKIAKLQAELTHAHPNCIIADTFFLTLLGRLLRAPLFSKGLIIKDSLEQLKNQHSEFYRSLDFDPNKAWETMESSGSIFNTLRLALWALLRFDNFEDILLWSINRGGDSDTVGAVVGALAGAQQEFLPEKWLKVIQKRSEIESLVTKILTVQ